MASIKIDPNLLKKHPNAFTQDDLDRKSRFLGSLAGLAIGDALGAGYENDTAEKVAQRAPAGPKELVGGGPFGFKAGEPTDDTQLAMLLMETLVSTGKFDLNEHGRKLVAWLNSKPRDVGNTTRMAIENLRAGDPPDQSGAIAWEDQGRKASGNGSVMYCAPIGLLHLKQQDLLVEDAIRLSRMTHYDPRCVAGCVAVCTAVAALVRGDDDAIDRAVLAAQAINDDVRAVIERGRARPPESLKVDGEDRGWVLHTVEIAFSALSHAENFEDGLVSVVARGGDTDTNAAVAGALLGAKFGRGPIPDRWLKGTQAVAKLTSLGEQLHKAVTAR